MDEKVITLKSTKIMGIFICIVSALSFLSVILSKILLNDGFYFINFLYLIHIFAISGIGVYFILKDTYKNIEKLFPACLIIISLNQLLTCFISSGFNFVSLLESCCFAFLGFMVIDKFKKIKIADIIILILIGYNILNAYFGNSFKSYYIINGYYNRLNSSLVSTGYTGLVFLLALFIYFLSHTNKKDINFKKGKSKIKINVDITDIKTLLKFIETQYKNGEITEAEYKRKRTEILNKL